MRSEADIDSLLDGLFADWTRQKARLTKRSRKSLSSQDAHILLDHFMDEAVRFSGIGAAPDIVKLSHGIIKIILTKWPLAPWQIIRCVDEMSKARQDAAGQTRIQRTKEIRNILEIINAVLKESEKSAHVSRQPVVHSFPKMPGRVLH